MPGSVGPINPEHAHRKISLRYPETRFLDKWGFLVPWFEWALVWSFSDSRALATLVTLLPIWLSTMSTQWFNVRAHGGKADEHGCTATTYKFSSALLLGEWEHRDHHDYPRKAHRPGPDLPYWLVLFPLAKLGAIWDLQKK